MTTIRCSKCGLEKDQDMFGLYRAHSTGRRPDCRQCRAAVAKTWRTGHPEEHKARANEWRKAQPEKFNAIQRAYAERNREARRALCREHQKANRPADAARSAMQRAHQAKARPQWASSAYIAIFYELAAMESERTGTQVHVDHIYPLNSPLVCGLHVEDNLQLLFAVDNIRKGNRMPQLGEASSQP